MTPQLAQIIIRDFPQDALENYVEGTLKELSKEFETVKIEDLRFLQGRITEVRSLLRLREIAQNVLNQARKVPNG